MALKNDRSINRRNTVKIDDINLKNSEKSGQMSNLKLASVTLL